MHTETNETMVIYQDLHDQDKIYARPYAVSYTHLDVYKRQILIFIIMIEGKKVISPLTIILWEDIVEKFKS